ncbi:MAG: preprotein translocase subunit SecE [Myxococcota bacterium]
MQGTLRIVYFAYLLLGVVVAAAFGKLFAVLFSVVGVTDAQLIGEQLTLSGVLGIVVAVVAGLVAVNNAKAHEFSLDVVSEMRRVTWPSREETQRSTVIVIVTTLIISGMLGIFDYVWAQLTGLIYS